MVKLKFPVRFGRDILEMVVVMIAVFRKDAVRKRFLAVHRIRTRLIQSNRVERSEHSDIRDNRSIIFRVAVTVWGDIHHKTDMELRTAVDNRERVFRHLLVEQSLFLSP